ncbi:hypothetical protein L345_13952, partial [Ophiophagus hannah]
MLEKLQTLLLQKNKLTYLPQALVNLPKLSLLVVSSDNLVQMPTAICDSSTGLKFISLKDNPLETTSFQEIQEITESDRDRELFEKEFMKAYIMDIQERVCTFIRGHQNFNSELEGHKMIVTAETQETSLLPPSVCLDFCSADVIALFIIIPSIFHKLQCFGRPGKEIEKLEEGMEAVTEKEDRDWLRDLAGIGGESGLEELESSTAQNKNILEDYIQESERR